MRPPGSIPREVLRSLATARRLWRLAKRPAYRSIATSPRGVLDGLSGFDFFISYARRDARKYAAALREQLAGAGLRCFLDDFDFFPGDSLSEATAKSLRRCSAMIVVGSPGVAQSRFVPLELAAFARLAKPVIPIDVGGALQGPLPPAIATAIEGRLWIDETTAALATGPSPGVIGDVVRRVDFTRQESWRQRILAGATALFAAVACAAVLFGLAAKRQAAISLSRQRAAESLRLLGTEPQRLKESLTLALDGAEAWATPEAVAAVRQALRFAPPVRRILQPRGGPSALTAAFAPAAQVVAISVRTGDTFEVRFLGLDGAVAAPALRMPKWPEALAFDPGGNMLAVGLRHGGGVQLWEWRASQLKSELPHPGNVHNLAWRDRSTAPQIATACSDGRVRLWEIAAPQHPASEWLLDDADPDLAAPVYRVAFDASGDLLAAAGGRGGKGRVRLRDLRSGADIFARDLDGAVTALDLTPDGQLLAAGTLHGRLEVWRVPVNETLISRAAANAAPIDSVALRADGRFVACAGWEKAACVWDLTTMQEVLRVPHSDKVAGLRFIPGDLPLLTASFDGAVGLWPAEAGGWEQRWTMEKRTLSWVRFSPSQREWWCGSIEGVRRGSLKGAGMEAVPGIQFPPGGFALAPDGRTAVIGTMDGQVALLDVVTGSRRALPRESDSRRERSVRSVVFSPDGSRVAAAGYDGRCDAWEVASGAPLFHAEHAQRHLSVIFSCDGSDLLYDGDNRELGWRRLDGSNGQGALPCPDRIEHLAPHPRAPEAAVLAGRHVLLVRREKGGWVERDRKEMPAPVTALAWSPDGGMLFIGLESGHAVLCKEGRLSNATQQLHTARVTSAAFSGDGRLLATGSADGTAALWQVPGPTLLSRFEHPGVRTPLAAVQGVDLTADGAWLLTGSSNGRIYLWASATKALLLGARARSELLFGP